MKKEFLPLKSEYLPLISAQLNNSKFYLFGSAVAATALYVIWLDRVVDEINPNRVMITVLLGLALVYSLWQRREKLDCNSGIVATIIGILLIIVVLLKSISLFWFEYEFVKIAPVIFFFGLALLASGFKGLKQYWREFIIVLVICLPTSMIENSIENGIKFTVITTKFSAFLLWYLGFDLQTQGNFLALPDGAVQVILGCTGLNVMILMFQVSIALILIFPLELKRQLYLFGSALIIGFFTGVIRVGWLVLVVSDREAFAYWHGPQGASIFSTMTVVVFGILCQKIIENNPKNNQDLTPQV